MHVVIDARLAAQRHGGIAVYTAALCGALATLPDRPRLGVLYGRRGAPLPLPADVRQWRAVTPAHHPWEGITLGVEMALRRPDLIHAPDFIPPHARACPAVVTIHDLAFLYWPEILDAGGRRHYGQVHAAAANADHIIAVSEATRRDVLDLLGVPPAKVTVVPEAADPIFCPLTPDDLAARAASPTLRPATRRLVGGALGPYLLAVGTLEPRKNLPLLLRAYDRMVAAWPGAPALVLAGRRGWLAEETLATLAAMVARERVHWLEGPSQEEVVVLYAGALALVFPSRHEGFGLPALEAMASGTPVLASDTPALRELVGPAGWLAPVDDEHAWADAMARISQDAAARAALAAAGLARAAEFSWARAAAETLAVYRRVARHA
jgi:glycosyltransferase involved in cell wall biosynthesis